MSKRYAIGALLVGAGLLSLVLTTMNKSVNPSSQTVSAAEILGSREYKCISYGAFREKSRSVVPSVAELKEDMQILHRLGYRVIRTYHTQKFEDTRNLLKAIEELKQENQGFEMFVMLGAWIECADAWTDQPNHSGQNLALNSAEVEMSIELANSYPEIVKIIAVGNEAMVHWASAYFVKPEIILEWVRYLKTRRIEGELPESVWITSSDNFASWGGGGEEYHTRALNDLIKEVDYVSLHTYPFHDTHYNPDFWYSDTVEGSNDGWPKIIRAMERAVSYARTQYYKTARYVHSVVPDKPLHIGESGWASISSGYYGNNGSRAADEIKQKLFYDGMQEWTGDSAVSLFFFEAFDEPWKDPVDEKGSENHFGLIDIEGRAKYVLWDKVADGTLDGLKRNSREIRMSYAGSLDSLRKDVLAPELKLQVN